ncbi:MAG: tetratricopeptide repeat protein [Spirochaetaceae bacterium]|jgi:putative GTP pyrophosphokinase|nr:tetratricopeptide repeat protein [Spirochaetaceae bacterium]
MNNTGLPDRNSLLEIYEKYQEIRAMVVKDLEGLIEEAVFRLPSRPTVKGRIKDFSSYYKKYIKFLKENPHSMPEPLITDLIGIRIVCPFIDDMSIVEEVLKKKFDVIEVDRKGADYTFKEFGYESTHLLINIPDTILEERGYCGVAVAEIQIRTILQEAWAEVEHELVYKAEFTPFDEPMKRKLAAVNASLALADITFQEIRNYQRQLNGELEKRRGSFFKKIEESIDGRLFSDEQQVEEEKGYRMEPLPAEKVSIDDLLLNALYAHNKNRFDDAIRFYSRILEMKPDNVIASLIYKHRGMANFAQSYYGDALEDFSRSLELDPKSYKAAYYRGVVRAVEQRYAEAIDDFTLALTINPYQNFCFYRRGQAYYHLGDYPQALADCEAALVLDPGSEQIKKFKGLLLEKLKM